MIALTLIALTQMIALSDVSANSPARIDKIGLPENSQPGQLLLAGPTYAAVKRTIISCEKKMKRKLNSASVSSSSRSSRSQTGCSQDFARLVLSSPIEKNKKQEKGDGQVETSKAMGLLVERAAPHGLVLPHLVQKSIFAYGPDVSDADEKYILNKINKIAREYIANRYTTVIKEFELPFDVKATWGITEGYKATKPKAVKVEEAKEFAPPVKKRKNT